MSDGRHHDEHRRHDRRHEPRQEREEEHRHRRTKETDMKEAKQVNINRILMSYNIASVEQNKGVIAF